MRASSWYQIIGSSILISIACIDPGNLLGDIQVAQKMLYKSIWVITMSHILLYFFQELAFVVSCKSENDLGELIKLNYPRSMKLFLWLSSELAIISADIQEILGATIALRLLTGLSDWIGIPVIIVLAIAILFLQEIGQRALEFGFLVMVAVLGICFFINFIMSSPEWLKVADGFIPSIPNSWEFTAVIGAVIMPQNIFLHSSLVQTKFHIERDKKYFIKIFRTETVVILIISCIINISLTALFSKPEYSEKDISLENVHIYLKKFLPQVSFYFWAFGLLSSGLSSTTSGALTGQYIMNGIFDFKFSRTKRILITRLITLLPCYLIILWTDVNKIMNILNIVQFVQLPFVIIPLIKFANNKKIMNDEPYSQRKLGFIVLCASFLQLINVYSIIQVMEEFSPLAKGMVILFLVSQFGIIFFLAFARLEEQSKSYCKKIKSVDDFDPTSPILRTNLGKKKSIIQ